jgi:hypothetical protein
MNKQAEKVKQEIMNAARQGIPINFSRFKHRWIVDALRSLVFNPSISSKSINAVRAAFSDGTETRPFPFGCFTPSSPPEPSHPVVRVGLNSGRHPEMDRFVDLYLFRNVETNSLQTIAEQEQYAFQQGKDFLQNSRWRGGGIVEMHQTGLEPLIVGFYRAVVTVSLKRKKEGLPPVIIQPCSWAPPFFPLQRYVFSRMPNDIGGETVKVHTQKLGTVLEQMIKEFPGFFTLLQQPDDLVLKWLPERPMWQAEHDILFSKFSRMKTIWQFIYKKSQFMKHSHWGYSI